MSYQQFTPQLILISTMPEIGEVARVVHYIRKNLVNRTLTKVTANVDEIVYGKVGTSAAEFEKHMLNKKVIDVGQQGKYFWMVMSSPPHPVMHLGMSGWFKFQNEHTYYYRKKKDETDEWPPKYAKFVVQAKAGNTNDTVEAAFVDARRLGRIRLVHCDGQEIRKNSPLKENGPDPVIDEDIVTLDWLTEKCHKKKVPIKAMLLDQAVISGIGNWVADEIMYNAKIHPEQYANTLQDAQIKQLYKSLHYVCKTTCDLLADSEQFPEDWLFKHRWSKGKKDSTKTLPNGNKIIFLTVGGRTSAVVPAVQKKTGPVAGDIGDSAEDEVDEEEKEPEKPKGRKVKSEVEAEAMKPAKGRKRKAEPKDGDIEDTDGPTKRAAKLKAVKSEEQPEANGTEANKPAKRSKKATDVKLEEPIPKRKGKKAVANNASKSGVKEEGEVGRRRSGRLRN